MSDRELDARIRLAAFEWLGEQIHIYGDVLPRRTLEAGFFFENERVPLVGPQGIFKPKALPYFPLSITTSPESPYNDTFADDGLLRYRYRGGDPNFHENRRLREAMRERVPLVYFHGIGPGKYVAVWPVFIVHDDPANLTFSVAVDDAAHVGLGPKSGYAEEQEEAVGRRAYVTSNVRARLHQRAFRERVLEAYVRQCAFCRLRHEELLDAAHIIPDSEPEGEPRVSNGLALCNLHHAAFDRFFIGLRRDYVIEVRPDILREGDGPTLRHAIQGLHGQRILLPTRRINWPDQELVAMRYERFREKAEAGGS